MSAIDHAEVHIHPGKPTTAAVSAPRSRRRGRLTAPRAAVAFACAQLPLAVIAIAAEWRDARSASSEADYGPIASDVLLQGSPISGPISAQLILLTLAFVATRRGRRPRTIGTALIGVMGLLVVFNGAASVLADHESAPQAIGVAAGIGFVSCGIAFTTLAIRDLRRARHGDAS